MGKQRSIMPIKQLIIILALIFLVFDFNISAETLEDIQKKLGAIEVSPSEIQLGDIVDKKSIKSKFIIRNTGDTLLQIKKIRPSCDCLVILSYPKEIFPGDARNIEVILNPEKLNNNFTKYIYIQSSDLNKPVIRISVKGLVPKTSNAQDSEKQISELESNKI